MMYAESAQANYDSPSRRPMQHFRFVRNAKDMDMKDAKAALDIIIRPSLQLWKLALGRSVLTALKRPPRTVILDDTDSSGSSMTLKKRVRFDEQPVTISRKGFLRRLRRDSSSFPARPCLVIRQEYDDTRRKPAGPPLEAECRSVYEDCLADYPGFLADLHILEGDSGIATFDRTGYANYCLSRWLDKQREEVRTPKKLVFEDPTLLPWPSRALLPPFSNSVDVACPMQPSSRPICKPSLPRRVWKHIEDELQNVVVVLIIGLFVHMCLIFYLLYDVLTRGLVPSDD